VSQLRGGLHEIKKKKLISAYFLLQPGWSEACQRMCTVSVIHGSS